MRRVALGLLILAACASAPPPSPNYEHRPARPVAPPEPRSASYDALDGALHYYAITRVEPFEEHYFATYHHVEGAYCELVASNAGARVVGCGFPSSVTGRDVVPPDLEARLPSLRDALRTEEPEATSIGIAYEGTFRLVVLEEEVPCEGHHGHGYNQVELRFDAAFTHLVGQRYRHGSGCGAAPFYWASAHPRWLAFTSTKPLLAPDTKSLPPDLFAAVVDVLTKPDEDHSVPPKP